MNGISVVNIVLWSAHIVGGTRFMRSLLPDEFVYSLFFGLSLVAVDLILVFINVVQPLRQFYKTKTTESSSVSAIVSLGIFGIILLSNLTYWSSRYIHLMGV